MEVKERKARISTVFSRTGQAASYQLHTGLCYIGQIRTAVCLDMSSSQAKSYQKSHIFPRQMNTSDMWVSDDTEPLTHESELTGQ